MVGILLGHLHNFQKSNILKRVFKKILKVDQLKTVLVVGSCYRRILFQRIVMNVSF